MGHYSSSCSSLLSWQSVQPPCSPSTLTGVSVSTLEKWLTCAQQEVLWVTRWLLLWQHALNKLSLQEGHLIEGEEKGKKCPTMDEIFEDIEEEFGDDACVYNAMGWLDEEGSVNNETITMDVMSLPLEVSAMITHEGVSECTENMINYMGEDPTFKRCSNKYSEEELAMLSQVGHLIAGFKCFQDSFNQACNSYLKDQMFGQVTQPEPAGRTFGCFQTCQAANFASTTSCTFGLFFKRTKPCNLLFPALAGIASG